MAAPIINDSMYCNMCKQYNIACGYCGSQAVGDMAITYSSQY